MTNGKSISRWLGARLCTLGVGLSVLMLASCETPPKQTLPKISDIRPPRQTDAEGDTVGNRLVIAMIHRIDLPLDEPLDDLWQTVNEGALPLPIRGKWMINGLRIGVLHAEQAQAFYSALPRIQGESRTKLASSGYPSTIRATPRLRKAVMIDLTDPPKSPVLFRAIGGRLELRAQISRDEQGQVYLQLTPHHYKSKTTLLPRSPMEKQLDGQTFDALRVRIPLPSDRAVIVGLYRPWLMDKVPAESASTEGQDEQAEPTSEEVSEEEESTQQANQSEQPERKPPEIPNHLGRALMAGMRAGRPTQMLLVISVVDE